MYFFPYYSYLELLYTNVAARIEPSSHLFSGTHIVRLEWDAITPERYSTAANNFLLDLAELVSISYFRKIYRFLFRRASIIIVEVLSILYNSLAIYSVDHVPLTANINLLFGTAKIETPLHK